jgi:hypothetical protein
MTVVCDRLDIQRLHGAVGLLAGHCRVRQLTLRNDSGVWNIAPDTYPDGIYLGIDYRDGDRKWNIDIWFVADAERHPDLQHVRELSPDVRAAILEIKRAWRDRPEYRRSVTSLDICRAVLDNGVRTAEQFERLVNDTADGVRGGRPGGRGSRRAWRRGGSTAV